MTDTETAKVPRPSPDVFALAREQAGEWHGGQSSALYSFSSAGAIRPELVYEIGTADDYEDDAAPYCLLAVSEWLENAIERGDASGLDLTPRHRDDRTEDRRTFPMAPVFNYGADRIVNAEGRQWFAVYVDRSFQPSVTLVAADDDETALAQWTEERGALEGLAVGEGTGTPLSDYGATETEQCERLYWNDGGTGPFDIESVVLLPVAVWPSAS